MRAIINAPVSPGRGRVPACQMTARRSRSGAAAPARATSTSARTTPHAAAKALRRAALEIAGVEEPPSRADQAKEQAFDRGTDCASDAAENAIPALIWGEAAGRWAMRTAWD